MKKKLVLVGIVLLLIILAIVLVLFWNNRKIEVPDNPELIVALDFMTAPSSEYTYYFSENTIIEKYYSGGVLSTGPVSSESITKYYFKENIDLTSLIEFLNKYDKVENKNDYEEITVTIKGGDSYCIETSTVDEKTGLKVSSNTITHEIWDEILKITDKAYKTEEFLN